MRNCLILAASFAALTVVPAAAFADEVVVEPEVQGWVMEQSAPDVEVQGDVVVGSTLPESVEVIEVSKHKKYAFAIVNKRRALVEPGTRKIIPGTFAVLVYKPV